MRWTRSTSTLLGHSSTSFIAKTYVTLFPEIMKSAGESGCREQQPNGKRLVTCGGSGI
jgi:hypothetical protein